MLLFYLMSFLILNHPISIIFYILVMSVISLLVLLYTLKSSWVSLIFMMMMLGGLMVLFIYMASLSSNEYFKFLSDWWVLVILMMLYFPIMSKSFSVSSLFMGKLFNESYLYLFLFLFVYLFLVLVLVIEILLSVKSSLRVEI